MYNGRNSRFTRGAILSTLPFPTAKGLQVRFWTQTYGGNGHSGFGTTASDGADGIAFVLSDASAPESLGASGGALAYACGHDYYADPADGMAGGYMGIGIDEYGSFSNPGIVASDGPGRIPGSITVRGPSITYEALHNRFLAQNYYPNDGVSDVRKKELVEATCRSGVAQNSSGAAVRDGAGNPIRVANYPLITTQRLADLAGLGQPVIPIANQQAVQNQVTPPPRRDLANLLKFDLSITPQNNVNLSYTINDGYSITLLKDRPVPTVDNQQLPEFLRFGFTASTGGGSNVHEVKCFASGPLESLANNSAATSGKQSQKVQAGSQVYLAFYHPQNSWGQLTASNLVADASGKVSIAETANWDASCVLTGGACIAKGNTGNTPAQSPASRNILSWNGSSGVQFAFDQLAGADQPALGSATDAQARLNYLRGDRSKEIVAGVAPGAPGTVEFRRRDGVLGDIVNASAVWVGPPDLPYANAGSDLLRSLPIPEFGTKYSTFKAQHKLRTNVVYAGANDGMLHAFRAGSQDANGDFVTVQNDGQELMAYMPQAVVQTIHSGTDATDFTALRYAHNSFVDATPATGDLYYNGAWHTWLVGGLGGGGNATIATDGSVAKGVLYALDITDPAKFGNINANAATPGALVIGEWQSGSGGVLANLGSVYGTPIIRRLHDGNWAVIFGNGRNSATGRAGVYVMTITQNGTRSFRFLDTGLTSDARNGIDYVSSADLDGDHVTDYLYAGDSTGGVWRFDLSSSNPASWGQARRIFTTENGQPISTAVLTTSLADARFMNRVMVSFGTGRQTPQTLSSAGSATAGVHALYGIWDWDMAGWNGLSQVRYASLANGGNGVPGNTVADLQRQSITGEVQTALSADQLGSQAARGRTVSQLDVCWRDQAGCGVGGKIGWQLPLSVPGSGPGEQIIASPVFAYNTFFVNTFIPPQKTDQCTPEGPSGFTMAISLATGGAPEKSVFTTASAAAGINASGGIISGLALGATGTPAIVTAAGKPFLVQQTSAQKGAGYTKGQNTGVGSVTQIDPPPRAGKRLTWTRLR